MLRGYQRDGYERARTLPELQESFELVSQGNISREKSYDFLKDQLRSIRQELVVVGGDEVFSLRVYKHNTLLSLRNGDVAEFSICTRKAVEHLSSVTTTTTTTTIVEEEDILFFVFDLIISLAQKDFLHINVKLKPYPSPLYRLAISLILSFSQRNYIAFFSLLEKNQDKEDLLRCIRLVGLIDVMKNEIASKTISVAYRPAADCEAKLVFINQILSSTNALT